MMIVGDTTTWSITRDNSRGLIYDRKIIKIQATEYVHRVINYDHNMLIVHATVSIVITIVYHDRSMFIVHATKH